MSLKNIDTSLEQFHNYNILVETRELFLNPKNSNSETDIKLATEFIKNLRILENISKDNILIHLYNYGGEYDAGFAIYDNIKNSECYITILIHGACQSVGLLILQASDNRLSTQNCVLMCHEGTSAIHSDLSHKAAKSWSAQEKKKEELLYEIFTEKCLGGQYFIEKGSKRSQVKAYLRIQISKLEDWILSPEEAKYYGFLDDIVGSKKYPNINSILTK